MGNSKTITIIDLARKSIRIGETIKAFPLLFECIEMIHDEEIEKFKTQLYLYSNNFTQLENSQRQNVISNGEYLTETNRVTNALLKTILDMEMYLNTSGKGIREINHNNSFTIPRDLIQDKLYYGFLITGLTVGSISGLIFMFMYYRFLMYDSHKWEELLFIASIGVTSSMFLTGAFDGLNRQKEQLVDRRIVLPHVFLGILLLLGSGFIAMFKH